MIKTSASLLFIISALGSPAYAQSKSSDGSETEPSADGKNDVRFSEIGSYVRGSYKRKVTHCDRLAAHPSDPEKVAAGVSQSGMDKPNAIRACLAAVQQDPENPRLNYQLARAYGYSGLHAQGRKYSLKALQSGYPQSLFVVGYVRLEGWDGRKPDVCFGGELVRRSAKAGRYAGLIGFPHYVSTGRFKNCGAYPVIDKEEIAGFLDQAEKRADGYYQQILVKQVKAAFE